MPLACLIEGVLNQGVEADAFLGCSSVFWLNSVILQKRTYSFYCISPANRCAGWTFKDRCQSSTLPFVELHKSSILGVHMDQSP